MKTFLVILVFGVATIIGLVIAVQLVIEGITGGPEGKEHIKED